MLRTIAISALIAFASVQGFAQSTTTDSTLTTVEEYNIGTQRLIVKGQSDTGEVKSVTLGMTPTHELFKPCDANIRQMMLKPGKWTITVTTSSVFVIACKLTLRRGE